jgi:2-oxoisovalerate dehydrogenase E1 component
MASRVEIVDQNFRTFIESWKGAPRKSDPKSIVREGSRLTGTEALELFESQITSRLLDYEARHLRAENLGFYTIGSAGHECNAVLGRLLKPTDPAFLHYRSGALVLERSRQVPGEKPIEDILLSYSAAAEEPISGGRHKVWGSKKLWIPPQTSTIASHLPKAVGAALAIARAKRLSVKLPVPADSIVACSFGDASANHSTALGAFNSAQWAAFQRLPIPILFICEDNGIGISVRTPKGWIDANFSTRPGLRYFTADGLDLVDSFEAAREAIEYCRENRAPAFLHLRMVRLLGHAGSDVETEYLSIPEIEELESRDPLLKTAAILLESGIATSKELLDLYDRIADRIRKMSEKTKTKPRLSSVDEIVRTLAPYHPKEVEKEAKRTDYKSDLPEEALKKPRHLAMLINWGLADLLTKYPEMMLFGEDVAKKGGVYHVTTGLSDRFGAGRVFNTLLDEQTILGLAIGSAHLGFLPVPEIQYLAYYHNAEDQIRGEAGSLQFFSNDQFRNPMVIRIASFAYQKGFGGHFHNDNVIGALREIPGITIAAPARGDDAVGMLRTAMALAKIDGRVVFFLEPIALYMTKDLQTNDGLWQNEFPKPGFAVPYASGRVYEEKAKDLLIISYANGLYLSLRAAKVLREKHKINARVLDLRWLHPLPEEEIRKHAGEVGKVLIVDECRKSGGIAEAVTTLLCESGGHVKVSRLTAVDTYLPLGPAANLVLPSEDQIIEAAKELAKK